MSTVAEIKAAISRLPHGEQFDLGLWLAEELGLRLYTDDGFDVEKTRAKLLEADRGKFRKWTDEDWQRLHDSVA